MKKETPMMEQYHRIKNRNKDSILLFRLGDFYEMFESDAVDASSILNITLTRRNAVPMCGFPHHAADTYIAKLINNGKKIAICEQRNGSDEDDPIGHGLNVKGTAGARGIVKREVVEIISPGMITNPELLKNKSNNFIAALYGNEKKRKLRLACGCLDISTGEFLSIGLPQEDTLDALQNEIESNGVREILHPESFCRSDVFSIFIEKLRKLEPEIIIRAVSDQLFSRASAGEALKGQFSIANAGILEIKSETGLIACGAVLAYVQDNVKHKMPHIRWVTEKRNEGILVIDNATKKHLELTESQTDGSHRGTLLGILDKTVTAMGGRLLKKRINNPSRNLIEINDRLEKTGYFVENSAGLEGLIKELSNVLDIERIISRLSVGKGNARELIGLKNSLLSINRIRSVLEEIKEFREEAGSISDFSEICEIISSAIVEDPAPTIRDGGIIKNGFSEKLDEFRKINLENREWINRYQGDERERTGIASLKVKYNKIIGYYIEVTKPNLDLVPSSYLKKQTLVNAERFTTGELEKHEALLMEAREDSNTLEFTIFEEIRNKVLDLTDDLYHSAEIAARLDVYTTFALAAAENGYVMPEMVENNVLEITGGRHPVVEELGEESFIENDLFLNDRDRRIMILTGPNMAGKSTYLRQAALITIMAHVGSFVPAKSAVIGLVDRVFSRIGSADRLVKGESTFLVEMIETSRILHYASHRSLIIMDEIGRGTSTYDGLSIAWAVLEYLLDEKKAGAKVLFATHYHEITALGKSHGVVNYNATVKEWNDSIIFLRKIVPGSASKSYGVEVARMAGIPDRVIERAKSILNGLEAEYGSYMSHIIGAQQHESSRGDNDSKEDVSEAKLLDDDMSVQLGLFPSPYEILINELKNIDINQMTPIEALALLDRLQKSME